MEQSENQQHSPLERSTDIDIITQENIELKAELEHKSGRLIALGNELEHIKQVRDVLTEALIKFYAELNELREGR